MRAINASVMRSINRKLILNEIRMRPISRAELSEVTRLTRASVTQIVEELIAEGIVVETHAVGRMRLGRRSTLLGIPPGAGAFFGVVLGRHRLSVGAIDMVGEVQEHSVTPLESRSAEETVEAIAATVNAQRTSLKAARVFGLGVCAAGTTVEGLDGASLARALSERTGIAATSASHVDARALEEMYFRDSGECFALVYAGEQVGASVISEGRLYHGAARQPVNLGGMAVDLDLKQGGLGEWLSEAAVLEGSGLSSWSELYEHRGEEAPKRALERFERYMTFGVINLAQAFAVPRVVLAGDIFCQNDDCVWQVADRVMGSGLVDEKLVIAQGGSFNPVRMAASVAYDDFFSKPLEQ